MRRLGIALLVTSTLLSGAAPSAAASATAEPRTTAPPSSSFAQLEREADARLGVYAMDTGTGEVVAYRAGERFAFVSTVKALASGAVLDRLTRRQLDRRLFFTQDDLVDNSPVTSQHVADGMTVREVIDAAITVSDNTAGNLLFGLLGGPDGVERELRRQGDHVISVDRIEPDLNTAVPGDRRDTTTPRALVRTFGRYVLGDALPRGDRRLLNETLERTSTGDALIRAGVPDGWTVGDKTGSASYGTRNDVAVVRPPGRAPLLIAVLTTHDSPDAATDDALVAAATRVVVDRLSR